MCSLGRATMKVSRCQYEITEKAYMCWLRWYNILSLELMAKLDSGKKLLQPSEVCNKER